MTTLQKTIKILKKHVTSTLKGLDFSERVLGGRTHILASILLLSTQNPLVLMRTRGIFLHEYFLSTLDEYID